MQAWFFLLKKEINASRNNYRVVFLQQQSAFLKLVATQMDGAYGYPTRLQIANVIQWAITDQGTTLAAQCCLLVSSLSQDDIMYFSQTLTSK